MNKLFFGDNLHVLQQHVDPNSVDLVYLDPPFNSKARYNILYEAGSDRRETAQRTVFRDTWSWGDESELCFNEVLANGGRVAGIIDALTAALGRTDMMAYVVMMAARLIQIHRVMKPTGSLYLHCDPAASHYLKIILDAIFGTKCYRSEITWKRSTSHGNVGKNYGNLKDIIFFYTKSVRYTWNQQYAPLSDEYVASKFTNVDADGRRWQSVSLRNPSVRPRLQYIYKASNGLSYKPHSNGWAVGLEKMKAYDADGRLYFPSSPDGQLRLRQYLDERRGVRLQNIWDDIPAVNSQAQERLGYPTQKPIALLRRIIMTSSNPGDVVLDPFCGCGTTVHAAQELGRNWIGIDVSYYAIRLNQRRLIANFGHQVDVPIDGIPADVVSAEALADRDPYSFQQWAVSELGCQLWNDGRKGADGGIDGEMRFFNGPGRPGRLLAQVKGGRHIGPESVRAFKAVLDDAKAQMGVFFCRKEPTADMRRAAASAGIHRIGSTTLPRLQVFSLQAWFAGQRPHLPTPIQLSVPNDNSGLAPRRGRRRADPRQPQFTFVIEGGLASAQSSQVLNPAILPDAVLKLGS